MSQQQIFELFLKDMEQPALQFALNRSFRKWADLRDQLIRAYSAKTGISEEEFHTQLALKNAEHLFG